MKVGYPVAAAPNQSRPLAGKITRHTSG